jgi:hypothetical protein
MSGDAQTRGSGAANSPSEGFPEPACRPGGTLEPGPAPPPRPAPNFAGKHGGRLALWLGCTAFALSVVTFAIRHDLRAYMNADYYYAPALLQDVMAFGGRLSEWDLPPAPYLFPDVVLYAAWHAVVRNSLIALVLSGATLLAVFVAGWALVARRLERDGAEADVGPLCVLLAGTVLCTFECFSGGAVSAFTITGHFSATALAPYGLLLALRVLDPGSDRLPGAGLLVTTAAGFALAVFSDMLFLVQVMVPVAVLCFLSALSDARSRRRAVILSLSLAAGLVAGWLMLGWLDRSACIPYLQYGFSRAYAQAMAELAWEWATRCVKEQPLAAVPASAAVAFLAGLAVSSAWKSLRGSPPVPECAVPAFAVAAVLATLAATPFAGRWMEGYMYPASLGAPFAAAAVAASVRAFRGLGPDLRVVLAVGSAVTIAVNCGDLGRMGGLRRCGDGAAQWVCEVDREAARLGLTCGVTDYWLARPVTLFSRAGVVMVPSAPWLMPREWIGNRSWFDRFEPQFALCSVRPGNPDRIAEATVLAKFGPPLERIVIGDLAMLVYSLPGRGEEREEVRGREQFFRSWWRRHPSRVRFSRAGETASYDIRGGSPGGVSVFRAPDHPVGALAFWMTRVLPAGVYAITFSYRAGETGQGDPVGAWQAMRLHRERALAIGGGMLWSGTNTVFGQLTVDRDSQVDIRVLFSGAGTLALETLTVQRLGADGNGEGN